MNFTVVNLSPEDKIAEYGNILKESIGEEIKMNLLKINTGINIITVINILKYVKKIKK